MDTTNVQIKKQVFELLSALCVYSADGYKRALEALEHYKTFQSERYRHNILTFQLENEKQCRFEHISIGNVLKTALFFLFQVGKLKFYACTDLNSLWMN